MGTGIDGIKIGIDPSKTPSSKPPNKDKKSGSMSFFSLFPMIFSTSSMASCVPTTCSLSPKNKTREGLAKISLPDLKTRVTFNSYLLYKSNSLKLF